jgi:tripartite-type tricarboxylate transporter receptor subunit TctC
MKSMTGIDMLHVPYRASYMTDLLGGQVQVAFIPSLPVSNSSGPISYVRLR